MSDKKKAVCEYGVFLLTNDGERSILSKHRSAEAAEAARKIVSVPEGAIVEVKPIIGKGFNANSSAATFTRFLRRDDTFQQASHDE